MPSVPITEIPALATHADPEHDSTPFASFRQSSPESAQARKRAIPSTDVLNSQCRAAIGCFVAVTIALLLSPVSRLLLYGFPVMSSLVAMYVARRSMRLYITFILWLWMLAPLVRRIVDFRAGWIPATLILLAPYLATMVSIFANRLPSAKLLHPRFIPFLILLGTCFYGGAIGLLHFSAAIVAQDLLLWIAPLSIALLVFAHRDQLAEIYSGVESAFLSGLIVLGLYGLYQFFELPKWDVLWILESHISSIGAAEPFKVRVFSTMNSPQVFASFLSTGLLFAFASRSKLRFFSIPLGLLGLLLSLARSGWLGLLVGLAYLIFFLSTRQRAALVIVAALSLGASLVALQSPDINTLLTHRFETFTDISQDVSYMDRSEGYLAFFESLADYPYGLGVGTAASQQIDTSVGLGRGGKAVFMADSTIVTVITSFGVVGSIIFMVSFLMLLLPSFRSAASGMAGARAARAALLGLLIESALMAVLVGPTGFLTWLCLSLLVAQSAVAGGEGKLRTRLLSRSTLEAL